MPNSSAKPPRSIEAGHSAAWSWQQAIERRVAEVKQASDAHIAQRAADLHDVGQRVLRFLAETRAQRDGAARRARDPRRRRPHAERHRPARSAAHPRHRAPSPAARLRTPRSSRARSTSRPIVGAGAAVLELTAGITCILDGALGQPLHRAERRRTWNRRASSRPTCCASARRNTSPAISPR